MNRIIPYIFVIITGQSRGLPNIKWSPNCWTHNFFRFLELLFWLPVDENRCFFIKPSTLTNKNLDTGEITRVFFTFEAFGAYIEGRLREKVAFLLSPKPSWVLQRGAIALDTSTFQDVGASGQTFSHTSTGSNLVLSLGRFANTADGTYTGATYATVALAAVNDRPIGAGTQHTNFKLLVAPATGANNVVLTGTDTKGNATAVTYTGCAQTGQPDANNTATATATSVSLTLTTVADNCWAMAYQRGDVDGFGSNNSGVTTTGRGGANPNYYMDSNGALSPAGGKTVSFSGSNQGWAVVSMSLSPASATASFLSLTGAGS